MEKDYKALTLRLSPEEWKKFKLMCIEGNISMHKYLYQFVVKSIKEDESLKRLQNG